MAIIEALNRHKKGYERRMLPTHFQRPKKGKGLASDVARDIVSEIRKTRLTRNGSIKWLKNNIK